MDTGRARGRSQALPRECAFKPGKLAAVVCSCVGLAAVVPPYLYSRRCYFLVRMKQRELHEFRPLAPEHLLSPSGQKTQSQWPSQDSTRGPSATFEWESNLNYSSGMKLKQIFGARTPFNNVFLFSFFTLTLSKT